jgi:hypothetical protein
MVIDSTESNVTNVETSSNTTNHHVMDEKLQTFRDITGVDDETAKYLLEVCF